MAAPKPLVLARGRWQGKSRLHLPELSEAERITESESLLSITLGPRDTYATLDYTWSCDGEEQRGSLVAAQSSAGVTAGWADSWHQHGTVLQMSGEAGEILSVTGEYGSPKYPGWCWRIEVEFSSQDALALRMINISPEGNEEWAVDAQYSKARDEAK